MTYQPDCTLPEELLEQIAAEGLAELIRILINDLVQPPSHPMEIMDAVN